jgi:AbrB family looped-hinge helix DNA binding protein
MAESAKITSKNQITLPANVRKSLGVGTGDRVDFIPNAAGNFEIRARKGTFADLRGIIKLDRPIVDHELKAWIDEARAAGYGSEGE